MKLMFNGMTGNISLHENITEMDKRDKANLLITLLADLGITARMLAENADTTIIDEQIALQWK